MARLTDFHRQQPSTCVDLISARKEFHVVQMLYYA
jgi:hypothetical protein